MSLSHELEKMQIELCSYSTIDKEHILENAISKRLNDSLISYTTELSHEINRLQHKSVIKALRLLNRKW